MEPFTWSDRSGVLIARAWREPARDGVRVRVIWTDEVIDNGTSAPANVAVVDDREALLELVAGWLERVAERPASGPAVRELPEREQATPAGDPVPEP